MHKRFFLLWLLFAALLAAPVTAILGCQVDGDNRVSRRLLREIAVTVDGRCISASDGSVIKDLDVTLVRSPLGTDKTEEVAGSAIKTDADGKFRLDAKLNPDQWDYHLRISHQDRLWVTDQSTRVYSFEDASLDVGDLRISPSLFEAQATLSGTVRAAIGGKFGNPAIDGAEIVLWDATGSKARLASATSSNTGAFTMPNVPMRDATLEIKLATPASVPYRLVEHYTRELGLSRIVPTLTGGQQVVDLGRIFLPVAAYAASGATAPSIEAGLTVVLSWDPVVSSSSTGSINLDAALHLPGQDCDVNHLGNSEIRLPICPTLDPGAFGANTCIWPPFLGGESVPTVGLDLTDSQMPAGRPQQRVLVSPARPGHTLASGTSTSTAACLDATAWLPGATGTSCLVAMQPSKSDNGADPEIITVFREPLTRSWPTTLGYYYDYELTGGEVARRYPIGIAAYSAFAPSVGGVLNSSRATVEVWEAGALLQRFRLDDLGDAASVKAWIPFLLEIGAKTPNPTVGSDIYFRVVPFDRVTVNPSGMSHFYQDIAPQKTKPPMLSARSGVVLPDSSLAVLGTTIVGGVTRTAFFRSGTYGSWESNPIGLEGDTVAITMKGSEVVAAVGSQILRGTSSTEAVATSCSSTILSVIPNGDDLSQNFLVATATGLRVFQPATEAGAASTCNGAIDESSCMEARACALLCPTSTPPIPLTSTPPTSTPSVPTSVQCESLCESMVVSPTFKTAFQAVRSCERGPCSRPTSTTTCAVACANELRTCQAATVRRPTSPPSFLAYYNELKKTLMVADKTLYFTTVRTAPSSTVIVSWPTSSTDRIALSSTLTSLVERTGGALVLGTAVGGYTLVNGPAGFVGTPLRACSMPLEPLRGRPSPSAVEFRTMRTFGSVVVVGTPYGLARITAQQRPPPGTGFEDCIDWLPTIAISGGKSVVPPFPSGVTINDLVVQGNRLYVLAENLGLFHYDGEIQ